MSKSTYNIDPIPEPIIKPMNPEAINWLKWFMTDADSLRNWAAQIFGSDVDLNNSKVIQMMLLAGDFPSNCVNSFIGI